MGEDVAGWAVSVGTLDGACLGEVNEGGVGAAEGAAQPASRTANRSNAITILAVPVAFITVHSLTVAEDETD